MTTTAVPSPAGGQNVRAASDPRVAAVFEAIVRDAFPPLDAGLREMAEAALVYLVEELQVPAGGRVLVVEPFSGFLPTVLAHLAAEVTVLCAQPERAGRLDAQLQQAGAVDIRITTFVGDREADETGYDRIVVLQPAHEELGPVLRSLLAAGGRAAWSVDRAAPPRRMRRLTRLGDGNELEEDLDLQTFMPMLGSLLVEAGVALQQDVSAAVQAAVESGRRLGEELLVRGAVREEDLYRVLAQQKHLPFLRSADVLARLDVALVRRLPRAFLDHYHFLPIAEVDGQMHVATTDVDLPVWELGAAFDGMEVLPHVVTPGDHRMIWTAVELGFVALASRGGAGPRALSTPVDARAASLFEAILVDAVADRATAIHLESHPDGSRLRFRIDGCLVDVTRFHLTSADVVALLQLVAISAGIDPRERRRPQSGRVRRRIDDRTYDLRAQLHPTPNFETLVVQLRAHEEPPPFDELGFAPQFVAELTGLLRAPEGLVLFAGGAGAGTTKTLYASLRTCAADASRKVVSVEDPIAAPLLGVQQCEVDVPGGLGFPIAVRSVARLDPDVIAIDPLVDGETAREALDAVRAGHLVLAALRARSGVDAVQQLVDLGVPSGELAGGLLAVVAQRLARCICPDCRRPAPPDAALLGEVFEGGAPAGFTSFVGGGCAGCDDTGVRGVVPLVERLPVDADLRAAIRARRSPDELAAVLRARGVPSLRDDALRLVQAGVVALDEVRRVLPADLLRR